MKYFGLVDCNSFYCSCERVFTPEIRGKAVIVLSNNDGCAIAFTKEAKALGFGEMCEPYYQIKDRLKKHKVEVFSSNYSLYDNISRRVMNILRDFTPRLEIYSVDEAFLELDGFDHIDLLDYGKKFAATSCNLLVSRSESGLLKRKSPPKWRINFRKKSEEFLS